MPDETPSDTNTTSDEDPGVATASIPITPSRTGDAGESPTAHELETQVIGTPAGGENPEHAAEAPSAEPVLVSPVPGKKGRKKRSTLAKVTEIPVLIVLAFAIAVLIKTFLVQAFYIPSGSMIPTLHNGDRVLVEKISYRIGDPGRGDVVVFAKDVFGAESQDLPWYQDARNLVRELLGLPTGREEDYIKRVVAVGGDVLRYTGSPRKLFVNGDQIDQSYVSGTKDQGSPTITSDDCKRLDMEPAQRGCRVPAGQVFVMGDNRGNSEDSRVIGPVEVSKIVGKAFVIIWPPGDWSTL